MVKRTTKKFINGPMPVVDKLRYYKKDTTQPNLDNNVETEELNFHIVLFFLKKNIIS